MRRTPIENKVFGGEVYIDINGKHMSILKSVDYIVNIEPGKHKIKMYKSHQYDTFIGFAETEVNISDDSKILIKYTPPMITTQPGNIIVLDYESEEQVNEIALEREVNITNDYQSVEREKRDMERNNQNAILIFFIIIIFSFLIFVLPFLLLF